MLSGPVNPDAGTGRSIGFLAPRCLVDVLLILLLANVAPGLASEDQGQPRGKQEQGYAKL